MAYELTKRLLDGVLEIELAGSLGFQIESSKITRDILALIEEARVGSVLIDIRAFCDRLGVGSTYFHVESYPPRLGWIRTAVVDLIEHQYVNTFHELFATNRGRDLRFFTDIEIARQWLSSPRKP